MRLANSARVINNSNMARIKRVGVVVGVCLLNVIFSVPQVGAVDPKSSNFQFNESSIGTGGLYGASSTNYKANSSTGDIAVGSSSSNNYQVDSGTKTQRDPALSFAVTSPNASFGKLSPSQASTATSTFTVSNYTSYGYIVQVYGKPPSYNDRSIAAMDISGTSQPGVEQFGINLVANTSPVSFGTNPDNGQFGFGSVTDDYNVANRFRYISGETIAKAEKSSGETKYTISYLVNVSGLTPGGTYLSNQTLVVTGTY